MHSLEPFTVTQYGIEGDCLFLGRNSQISLPINLSSHLEMNVNRMVTKKNKYNFEYKAAEETFTARLMLSDNSSKILQVNCGEIYNLWKESSIQIELFDYEFGMELCCSFHAELRQHGGYLDYHPINNCK